LLLANKDARKQSNARLRKAQSRAISRLLVTYWHCMG